MSKLMLTFDYEGAWGMPGSALFNQVKTTGQILALLRKHQAKAVFFVTGKLVEEYPELICAMAKDGHEVGLHGYSHEHQHDLNTHQLVLLLGNLAKTSQQIEQLTGHKPKGYRSPYLMGPKFYDPEVYRGLYGIGMSWISNREIRQPEELARPDRLPSLAKLLRWPILRNIILVALNFNLIINDPLDGKMSLYQRFNWLITGQGPFQRPEGQIEYPLTSPLDCDMLGMPSPAIASDPRDTEYILQTLLRLKLRHPIYYNLNFHDWIIGSNNRLIILDNLLAAWEKHGKIEYHLPSINGELS